MNRSASNVVVSLSVLGAVTTLILVMPRMSSAQGAINPVTRPRVVPQINTTPIQSQYTYTKKRLTISAVDFLSSANNPSYTNTGEAILTFAADDVVDLPPTLTPTLKIYATNFPTVYKQSEKNPECYDFDTGTAGRNDGSRIYATWNKDMQTLRLKLMQTYYQIDDRSTSGNRGTSSDVFCIHVNFVDDQRKIWYFGKAVVRLFAVGREKSN